MNYDIAIIIPTFQRQFTVIRDALASIPTQSWEYAEVHVIEQNERKTNLRESIQMHFPLVKYHGLLRPNLPNARNCGILNSCSPIILFVDDDCRFEKECIEQHVRMHAKTGIHAVAGRIKQVNSNCNWPQNSQLTQIDYSTGEAIGNFDSDYEQLASYASGGNMSIKREVFQKIGYFNTHFIGNALYEEVEFFHRLSKKGLRVWYNPQACVHHYSQNSGGCHSSSLQQYLFERIHNQSLFYFLHCSKIPSFPFIRCIRNLTEFTARKGDRKQHSIWIVLFCLIQVLKAYIHSIKPKY